MTDSVKADDVRKLLDAGAYVVLYRNRLGSYTGVCARRGDPNLPFIRNAINAMPDDGPHITDDFLPSKVLYRLTEKATTGRIVDGRTE